MALYLKYITEEGLKLLKNDFITDIPQYIAGNKEYFLNKLKREGDIVDSYSVENFPSQLVEPDPDNYHDIENVALIHNALKGLPAYLMADEGFWCGLNFTLMWDYILKRRDVTNITPDQHDYIYQSFYTNFPGKGLKRSLFINCVSRLFWAGHLTYDDENSTNRYSLTKQLDITGKFFAGHIVPFGSSNISDRKDTCLGVLDATLRVREEGIKVDRDKLIRAIKYLNAMGGLSVIDTLSRKEIAEIVYSGYYKKQIDLV